MLQVGELVELVRGSLRDWGEVVVEGEIASLFRSRIGHLYFDLKDESALVRAVMFRGDQWRLELEPLDGLLVRARGRLDVYPDRGSLQLIVSELAPRGDGALRVALERLRAALAAEGLFDATHKQPLPFLPARIGLVTSTQGAAIHDFLRALRQRCPAVEVVVYDARVQGEGAWRELVRGMHLLEAQAKVDVIVLARGGGSFEDLLPFSDERVVRAVADCPVPVVSAVGHEQDTPLCDLAADVRASTPTAAGKLVVPELAELFGRLDRARAALARNVRRSLDQDRQRLTRSVERLRTRPSITLEREEQRLERTRERLRLAPALAVERKRAALEKSAAKLVALSPVQTLERGYAIVRTESGDVVTSTAGVSTGAHVDVTLADGGFGARVEEVAP